jgi:hypothetical protein
VRTALTRRLLDDNRDCVPLVRVVLVEGLDVVLALEALAGQLGAGAR